jgi:hypothetical protein
MTDDELVVVYGALSTVDALLHRELLEEAGIDVMEQVRESEIFAGVTYDALHSVLMVRPDDAEQARALLEAYAAEEASGELADEIPDSDTSA